MLNKTSSTLFSNWSDRKERSHFVSKFANSTGCNNILNLGSGGKRELTPIDNATSSTDVDFIGDVDFKINLDEIEQLPFGSGSFDLCCAMDVLEHLENFHIITEEMLRISSRYILISLPNSAAEFPDILRNKNTGRDNEISGYFSKYYRLPVRWIGIDIGFIHRISYDFLKCWPQKIT